MRNKVVVLFFFFFSLMLFDPSLQAQKKSVVTTKTVTVNGTKYYKHKVLKGETLYGLSIAYKVSVEELISLNPSVEKGLRADDNLIIPIKVKPKTTTQTKPQPKVEPKIDSIPKPMEVPEIEPEPKPNQEMVNEPEEGPEISDVDSSSMVKSTSIDPSSTPRINFSGKDYYLHDIKSGETLEEIAEAYQVPVETIMQYNPQVKSGMEVGQVLGIPVPTDSNTVDVDEPEMEDEVEVEQEEPEQKKSEQIVVPASSDILYTVQAKEDLYDIAKKFGVDISDLKAINEGLDNNPKQGTVIKIPKIINENDYIVHRCEKNERVTSLLKRWKVAESEFRKKNISVGSHVFQNQVVLIPIQPITDFSWMQSESEITSETTPEVIPEVTPEIIEVTPEIIPEVTPEIIPEITTEIDENEGFSVFDNNLPEEFDEEMGEVPGCVVSPENAFGHYKVALMIPLFLQDVEALEIKKESLTKNQESRSLSFLQFYEGFMMAVEKMTDEQGLKIDLTVLDVTDNVNTAQQALQSIENQHFDLIVGPFFGKSFAVIEEYAKAHDILVVNPLSTRNEVVEGNANVLKLKPSKSGQILDIAYLVRNRYPDGNVFILSREKMADSLFLNQLEHELNLAVNNEVTMSGNEFLQFAREESQRLEMGSRLVSTITVEGQVYSTNDLQNGVMDHVVLANPVHRYVYSSENLPLLISQLSGVRDNVIIAYGDDNVFATQVLNTLKKEADRVPITLVCAPDWTKFEKLLVESLLQMNAIYLTDNFVDYNSEAANRFVADFRNEFAVEPQNYAFEGYDVATYFLTALMRYGKDMTECLPYFKMPLLHTQYHFMRKGTDKGLENQNWSMYQYDREAIELVPVNPFKKAEK